MAPTSVTQEILAERQTAELFLSDGVLSAIMKVIGVLSSIAESTSGCISRNVPAAAV